MTYLSELVSGKHLLRQVESPAFEKTYDVIVCGLGTSGSNAALFSAENGLSVLGVETLTCAGGNHTLGGVVGYYFGSPGGRYEEMDKTVFDFAPRHTATTAETRKFLMEQALVEKGVALAYEAVVCGVYMEENAVIGLRVLQDGKITDYGAKVVMDCTAEGCVAAMAGCETTCGRASDGQMQPYTLVSLVYDGRNYRFTNIDFGRVNQYDAKALSQAVAFCRSYHVQEEHEGTMLISQMPLLGFREGRRIVAEEQVTVDDVFAERQTQTPMFYSYADLDKHGWDIAFDGEALGDWAIGANLGAYNVTVAVPYKAIQPKGFEGLLVPCRALGVDRDVSSCVRMNLDMKKAAETAAQWATLAVQQNKPLQAVDYNQLKARLEETGCLKDSDNRGFRIDGSNNWDGSPLTPTQVNWLTDPAQLEAHLKTETPGQAIWSVRYMGEKAVPALLELLEASDENTRNHAAFCLAMAGRREGLPLLRKMAAERDGLMLKDCRKNNNLRGFMAVYWLGRLADPEAAAELIDLICNENEQQKPVYRPGGALTTRYKVAGFDGVYFQFMSLAVMSLIRIGDAHADLRPRIAKAFADAFETDTYYDRITTRPRQSSEGNMVQAIKNVAFSAVKKWYL